MQHQIFISYAGPDQELVENFRSELKLRGINAWVYSLDKTIGSEIWNEIEDKIQEISCWIFIISNHSVSSNGQLGELKLVLQKVTSAGVRNRIIPLF
ncbi:MAG: toll/interleukin-1 receptor domain-containing protein [Gammaproteobacteria bacterium]|nr:toll/interleukin-1 receptor domain-containing protein [Gammaproteobacteria bacterium]